MNTDQLTAKASVVINASPEKVWEALTTPSLIKKYFFGTDAVSDWKTGSPLEFHGEWEGKKYHDKGIIKKSVPPKLFQYTYLSSMSGKEDKPENYNLVTYELEPTDGGTRLTILQDGNKDEASRDHSQSNWMYVLNSMKKMLE